MLRFSVLAYDPVADDDDGDGDGDDDDDDDDDDDEEEDDDDEDAKYDYAAATAPLTSMAPGRITSCYSNHDEKPTV